jgi:hypothetical protein
MRKAPHKDKNPGSPHNDKLQSQTSKLHSSVWESFEQLSDPDKFINLPLRNFMHSPHEQTFLPIVLLTCA